MSKSPRTPSHERPVDYAAYLRSDHWADVKRRYRASKLPQHCVICKSDGPVEFHHRTYRRITQERLQDLVPLCRECHQWAHDYVNYHDNKSKHNHSTAIRKLKRRYKKYGHRINEQTFQRRRRGAAA